jgi:O-antigen/teichoic acid export membrane protein
MLLREGLPIAASALGIALYTYAGPTVLKYARPGAELGIFSAGYKVVTILTIIPAAFTQVLYPVFSEFFAQAREKLEKALADSLRVITLISMPLASGALVVGDDLFRLVFPADYAPGTLVMQVLLLGNTLGYMNWVLFSFLLSIDRQAFLMRLSLGAGVVAAGLSMLLVPWLGYRVIPFGMAGTDVALFLIQIFYVRRIGYRHLRLRSLWRPAVAALVMAAGLVMIGSLSLFILIPVGAIVYVGVLVALRGVGEQERAIVHALLTRISPWRS